jgi:hypothetical protein
MDYVAICQHLNRMIKRAFERGQDDFAFELMAARADFGHSQTLQEREGYAYLWSLTNA